MNITVLGAGLVGSAIARDLSEDKNFNVTSVDINSALLDEVSQFGIKTEKADVTNPEILSKLLTDCDIAVNAVPGSIGYGVLKNIIETKTDVVDIAFYEQNPFELDELAKQNSVSAIVDCGLTPGLNNIFIGKAEEDLDEIHSAVVYVGGLPQERNGIFDYQAVFSPSDVIEEYTRPARLKENNELIVKPALTEIESIDFEEVGELEAFNSDGLRTLLTTVNTPNIVEKTIRYKGHAKRMEFLREFGFFNKSSIEVDGNEVIPFNISTKILTDVWKSNPDGKDFSVLRVVVKGLKDNKPVTQTYSLFDKYDEVKKVRSMARTTGYTAAMAVRLLSEKKFYNKGITPPEFLGKFPEIYKFFVKGLEKRNINIHEKTTN